MRRHLLARGLRRGLQQHIALGELRMARDMLHRRILDLKRDILEVCRARERERRTPTVQHMRLQLRHPAALKDDILRHCALGQQVEQIEVIGKIDIAGPEIDDLFRLAQRARCLDVAVVVLALHLHLQHGIGREIRLAGSVGQLFLDAPGLQRQLAVRKGHAAVKGRLP